MSKEKINKPISVAHWQTFFSGVQMWCYIHPEQTIKCSATAIYCTMLQTNLYSLYIKTRLVSIKLSIELIGLSIYQQVSLYCTHVCHFTWHGWQTNPYSARYNKQHVCKSSTKGQQLSVNFTCTFKGFLSQLLIAIVV